MCETRKTNNKVLLYLKYKQPLSVSPDYNKGLQFSEDFFLDVFFIKLICIYNNRLFLFCQVIYKILMFMYLQAFFVVFYNLKLIIIIKKGKRGLRLSEGGILSPS